MPVARKRTAWIVLFPMILLPAVFSACASSPAPLGSDASSRIPLFTYVFDDGNDTDYLVARPIFSEMGVPACSAIITGKIGKTGFLTVDQIRTLRDDGWEIMCHTVSHPHLPFLQPEELEAELAASKATLERDGFTVHNLVYPFNQDNSLVRLIARKYYRSGRGGGYAFDTTGTDPYDLKSFPHTHNLEQLERIADRAYASRSWLIVYQHKVDMCLDLQDRSGLFKPGERLSFYPSGAEGRFEEPAWFQIFQRMYCAPLRGTPLPGDEIRGLSSGAAARFERFVYDDKEALRDFLAYVRTRYPDMRFVTVDQGLDILGMAKLSEPDESAPTDKTVARTDK